MTTKELTYADLGVKITDIYEQMGYGDAQPDAALCLETEQALEYVSQWLRPSFTFFATRGRHDAERHELYVPSSLITDADVRNAICGSDAYEVQLNVGKIISRQLRGSEAYALFICTAGNDFHEWMEREINSNDMVKAFIAHSIGSVLAERCADVMEQSLQQSIDKLGWKRTNRFSPGYCGWHVREQQRLFPLFNGQTSGVHLTDSSLMIPIKSVSGVIGLGPDVRYNPYTCGICDNKQCYKRRKKS